MAVMKCVVCDTIYDEDKEGVKWEELADDWACHVCESGKPFYKVVEDKGSGGESYGIEFAGDDGFAVEPQRTSELEIHMLDIHQISDTGESIIEPMRTKASAFTWDEILIKGAQLAKIPLNQNEPVNTQTIIGPKAKKPLIMETPIYITHMSFGALSKEAKTALAKGSAAVKTAMCSGEGGILPESLENAYKYIFEYVPNRYSVTEDNLRKVDAIEIKIGQSTKPGMGGHLPGKKVTEEIAAIRGVKEGTDVISPSRFADIKDRDDLKSTVTWLRESSDGRPIGIKFAAGNLEADLDAALHAEPDFITIDGRAGGTGASPKFVKAAASVPTLFALYRVRKFLEEKGADGVTLLITGGFRISSDFAKALALGADAVALGTAALMAIGCQQYRICNTGKCPMGITTQDPELRANFNVAESTRRLENFLRVSTEELQDFSRLTGNADVHRLSVADLCTTNSEISNHTAIEHV